MTNINHRIATEVMGWKPHEIVLLEGYRHIPAITISGWKITDGRIIRDFYPETNISDAWLVVEKLRELGYEFHLHNYCIDGEWCCVFRQKFGEQENKVFDAVEITASLAVCKAALEAVNHISELSV